MQNKHCIMYSGFCLELNNKKKRLPYVKSSLYLQKSPAFFCGAISCIESLSAYTLAICGQIL